MTDTQIGLFINFSSISKLVKHVNKNSEAFAQSASVIEVFLKSSQFSQENACVIVCVSFLLKFQALNATLLKQRP